MQAIRTWVGWAKRQISRNRPERLWKHYAFALALIMGLLVATHVVNKTIIAHVVASAEDLKNANAQVISDFSLREAADGFASGSKTGNTDLQAAIEDYTQKYESLPQASLWSAELQRYFFAPETGLHSKVEQYLALADDLAAAMPASRINALNDLRAFHANSGLTGMQQELIGLFETAAESRTKRLGEMQHAILLISAIALVAEAIFIFLPAQMTVRSSMAALHHKTAILKKSKAQLQELNQRLDYLVNHDALTGLPNRSSVTRYMNDLFRKNPNITPGVLFVGLDDFKSLNDTAGHDFGDKLLYAVARRLESCIDSEETVARVGGDEFVLITFEPPEKLADRLMNSLSEPLQVEGRTMTVSASIGYLNAETCNKDALALIANAGIALQTAKTAGGKRIQPFSPSLRQNIEKLQKLQDELPDAIASGQIEPWFQPQICLSDGQVYGAEVLARWRHPAHGLLSPDTFLPAAVRAGMMIELDHAVWQSAMAHVRQWQSLGTTIPHISLNAAPETISDPHLIERLLLLLHLNGLRADQIFMEVLETTVIEGKDDMAAINIDSLAESGISLELDDFGTGNASLCKLTQLPLAGIKLDRSLIAPLPAPGADSVIRAILALAVELDLHVVAEGIEDSEQARSLTAYGCAVGQGYGFARPMSASAFLGWLQKSGSIAGERNKNVLPLVHQG